jgi:hypothetical protein
LLFRKQRKEDGQDRHKKKDKEIEHERQTDMKREIKKLNANDKQT